MFNKVKGILKIKSIKQKRVEPWFRDNGDKTLRLNYNELNENSIVFDVGGYEGQWSSDIFSKYCCKIYIFEPVIKYFKRIEERFINNNNIYVYNFGIEKESKNEEIVISKDSSSIYKKGGEKEKIQFVRAIDFIKENNIYSIDLMKINIEGGEYDLIEHLIETGFIKNIYNIQVQFHDFVPDAYNRMKSIQNLLKSTHKITYQYEFVWENWKLK